MYESYQNVRLFFPCRFGVHQAVPFDEVKQSSIYRFFGDDSVDFRVFEREKLDVIKVQHRIPKVSLDLCLSEAIFVEEVLTHPIQMDVGFILLCANVSGWRREEGGLNGSFRYLPLDQELRCVLSNFSVTHDPLYFLGFLNKQISRISD